MDRMCAFHYADNELGYIQAVIIAKDFPFYEKLGFVDDCLKVKKPKARSQAPKQATTKEPEQAKEAE